MSRIFFSEHERANAVRESLSIIELIDDGVLVVVENPLNADIVVVGDEIEYHRHHHAHDSRRFAFVSNQCETVGANTFVGNISDTIDFLATMAHDSEQS